MRDNGARKRIEELESRMGRFEFDLSVLGRRLRVGSVDDLCYYAGLDSAPRGLPIENVVGRLLRHLGLEVRHTRDSYTLEAVPDATNHK